MRSTKGWLIQIPRNENYVLQKVENKPPFRRQFKNTEKNLQNVHFSFAVDSNYGHLDPYRRTRVWSATGVDGDKVPVVVWWHVVGHVGVKLMWNC